MIQTLPQTELSQSPDLLRNIPPSVSPASRLVSSDQLPRRTCARSPTGAAPTISCPYYKSELYIVSEEQAFRSQPGRPFRNDDVADCVAIASTTAPSVLGPHRSFLRSPNVSVGGSGSGVDGQQLGRSYYGIMSPATASSAAASSTPVSLGVSGMSSDRYGRPVSASRQSLTESKWRWLHSNAMVPEQPSPVSLRKTTRLDIPSTLQSTLPLSQGIRQESAGGLTVAAGRNLGDSRLGVTDAEDQLRASRMYHLKTAVDRSAPVGEHSHRRKTTVDLIQSVPDVHRSVTVPVDDPSVRHWRHSSDDTSRRSAADLSSRKWDSYGLTLSLSGAAVPQSGHTLKTDVKKPDLDQSTTDLPQKLPVERIMRFDAPSAASQRPYDLPSRSAFEDVTSHTEPNSASPPLTAKAGRSGRLSVPDSIPIYFRAESSAMQSQPSSSCVETRASLGGSQQQPSSISINSSMYTVYCIGTDSIIYFIISTPKGVQSILMSAFVCVCVCARACTCV